jgi:hypothetical protein
MVPEIRCYHTRIKIGHARTYRHRGHSRGARLEFRCADRLHGDSVRSGAVGGVDIRGSASETSSIDTLQPGHITGQVHGIVLSGGSAFGLETASGVRRYLEQRGAGFRVGRAVVPIVPCAILFDLDIGKAGIRPTREMGESAAAAATAEPVKEGAVGAGTGATVGKIFGMRQAMKSGIGSGLVELKGGVLVAALVAVNAFGDVRDPATGKLIAGARRAPDSMELADTEAVMKAGGLRRAGRARSGATPPWPWSPPMRAFRKWKPPNWRNSPAWGWPAPSTPSTPCSTETRPSRSPSAMPART